MHTVTVTRTIDAPIDEVWTVLDDFGGVAKYNPHVESSGIIDGPDTGPGATRECVFSNGGRVEERIVEYESGAGYTVDFVDVGGMPLKSNVVELTVDNRREAGTAVTMTATFTPKFGPLGWLMAKTMMKGKFRETFEETLEGLEAHVHAKSQHGQDDATAEAASD